MRSVIASASLFRTDEFFLQPSQQNADDFWNTVIRSGMAGEQSGSRRGRDVLGRATCLFAVAAAAPRDLLRAVPAAGVERLDRGATDHIDHGDSSDQSGVRLPVPEARLAAASGA